MNPAAIPRQALVWFFLAQAAVIAPHVPRLPWWLLIVWFICAGWRIQVYRGHWSYPGKLLKSVLVFAVVIGILAWYRNPTALESAAGTVIALFFLKLLECYSRRDVYLLTFVAAFVALLAFLFDKRVLVSLWVFASLLVLFASLIALHDVESRLGRYRPLRMAGALFLQALPLMLILFLVFPRLGPVWRVPLPGGQTAVTGISDSMGPGDITRLGRSAELAFRAGFEGEIPPRSQLYWRVMVLDRFDGRQWTPELDTRFGSASPDIDKTTPAPVEPDWRYNIVMESTGRAWLPALGWSRSETDGVQARRDGTLFSRRPVGSTFRYRVQSFRQALPEQDALSPWQRRINLSLPQQGNPQTHAWAQALRAEHADDRALVQAVLRHFNEQPFVYTLQPPALGEHSVDEFLFRTRRGFCEHYASSFTFLMRAVGIPARVVVGYQGAEINPFEDYVMVRQYDAHAWAEVWLEGGWHRVDPTAAVAPERIEDGMQQSMNSDTAFMADTPLSSWVNRVSWLNNFNLWMDQMDYRWQRWVLDYDSARQWQVMERLLGEVTPMRMLALVGAVAGLALLGVLSSLWGREWWQPRDPVLRDYERFCRLMARQGLPRKPGEGPQDYARRIAEARPAWAVAVQAITDRFVSLSYLPANGRHMAYRQQLRQHVDRLRWRLLRKQDRH